MSPGYRDKYGTRSPFHHYFFNERLEKATRGLDLTDRDVLDIGAGTGNLYDHLVVRFPTMRFHATDVSAGMLAQSRIPEERRFVGHAYDQQLPERRFHAIFMLGVTTYMDPAELDRNLAFIADSLTPDGIAVITFSNRWSLDTGMRRLLRLPLSWFGRKDKVLASGLRTRVYGLGEVERLLARHLHTTRVDLLNHTVFPFNLLLPGPALAVARWLARREGAPLWLRWLSSDLLLRAAPLPRQPGEGAPSSP